MRRTSVVFGLLVAIMSTCAFGIIGTPTAELNKGQWNLGFDYTYSDMDLDDTKGVERGESGKIKLKEFEVKRTYLTIGYGICDNWEVYGQLGIADVKEKEIWFNKDNGDWYKWLTFDFDYGFAWGWGTRITLLQQDDVKWGVSAQMNFHNSTLEERIPEYGNYYWKENSKLETWDLLIAAGPTIDMGGWKLYGGGFYYDFQGDMSWKGSFFDETWKGSYDFEADGNVGGFIGAQFALKEYMDITTEYSATADSFAIGGCITLKF